MALETRRSPCGSITYRDPAGRQDACLTGGCVWNRLARLEGEAEGFTAYGTLLKSYYLDLAEQCSCPHGRTARTFDRQE